VLSNAIRVLEPGTLHNPLDTLILWGSDHICAIDGTERQIIKDMEGNNQRPKIKYCSICDPFVFILREDDTIGLFIGEPERGKIRRKDMSPMGEKVRRFGVPLFRSLIVWWKTSRYIAGSFFTDSAGIFKTRANENAPAANGDAQPVTSTLQAAMTAGQRTQWLMLCRPQGVVEVSRLSRDFYECIRILIYAQIWTLPKLTLGFSTTAIASLQSLLVDSFDPPALSLPQDPPRKPQDLDIEQILISPIGETDPWPYLLVLLL
jgi:cleavage and polyadenylation specificity factor subunit 1